MYQPGGNGYPDSGNENQYGHNYRNYRMNDPGIKGKIQQKYWKTKQKAIEKLGKDQDEFVISGDSEVDARLEAFQHIKITCMQLMAAIECYQNRIFALSQDENEMGRFLKDQGSLDKTKAGKMMIAVGKAQSFAAQQRLGMRSSLARLYSEIETFRFRAIQDTQLTVTKMEQSRSEYRAGLLWMADISKELDPDHFKQLDKFRDVQMQVKLRKKQFDKLKVDVIQKIDLLSASRCNLLSATLEPYQSSMVKFLSSTAKNYNKVHEEYKGHPSYKFNILKNIIPNNGIAEDDEEDSLEQEKESNKSRKSKRQAKAERAEEAKEHEESTRQTTETANEDDGVDKLISFDTSPTEESGENNQFGRQGTKGDLLTGDANSPGFGEYTESKSKDSDGFEDLLGKFEENNILADHPATLQHHSGGPMTTSETSSDPFSLIGNLDAERQSGANAMDFSMKDKSEATVDDLLFGSPNRKLDGSAKTELDILSDVLSNQELGITDAEQDRSFSGQWQSMFGVGGTAEDQQPQLSTNDGGLIDDFLADVGLGDGNATGEGNSAPTSSAGKQGNNMVDANIKSDRMYMPSFLLEQMRKTDPQSMKNGPPKSALAVRDNDKAGGSSASPKGDKKNAKGKDMSAWFNLFADLDPLANPDDLGASQEHQDEKQAC